ncbi:MAG: molybdate ABC transporter substrate-binding protein [Myxococcales bacterium]|nr:molybdate ABC transporter substrate-binding protein [Myxococcales bacterium]
MSFVSRSAIPLGLLCLLTACQGSAPSRSTEVRVAAAADLAVAFEALAPELRRRTGLEVSFTFGSSGLLARQLVEGAPFDVYVAASQTFMLTVTASGACTMPDARPFVHGRLGVYFRVRPSPEASDLMPMDLTRLTDLAHDPIAIANPEHAPYGVAAREALVAAGLFAAMQPRLVLAENVRQAYQLVRSGNVSAAFVSAGLIEPGDPRFRLIDRSAHAPIEQYAATCARGPNPNGGARFLEHLRGEDALALLQLHGFEAPPDRGP